MSIISTLADVQVIIATGNGPKLYLMFSATAKHV